MKPITILIPMLAMLCGCKEKRSAYFIHYSYHERGGTGAHGEGNATITMSGKLDTGPNLTEAKEFLRDNNVPQNGGPSNSLVVINWFTEIKQ